MHLLGAAPNHFELCCLREITTSPLEGIRGQLMTSPPVAISVKKSRGLERDKGCQLALEKGQVVRPFRGLVLAQDAESGVP